MLSFIPKNSDISQGTDLGKIVKNSEKSQAINHA
jgi:hypothetical protein